MIEIIYVIEVLWACVMLWLRCCGWGMVEFFDNYADNVGVGMINARGRCEMHFQDAVIDKEDANKKK